MPPGGNPSFVVKNLKAPERYRASPPLNTIQIFPKASSPNDHANSSFDDGKPGVFSRGCNFAFGLCQRARPLGEIVDTQMAPVESSKSRYTCGDANPSAVWYTERGRAALISLKFS